MAYVRKASVWRSFLGTAEFPYEANRYVVYVAHACPWANRITHMLRLKNLDQGTIQVCVVHPTWKGTRPNDPADAHCGWCFAAPDEPVIPGAILQQLRDGNNNPLKTHLTVESDCLGKSLEEVAKEKGIRTSNCDQDTYSGFHCKTLRDLYEAAGDKGTARFSTPAVWDTKKKTIVTNESADLIVMLNAWPAEKMAVGSFKIENEWYKDLYPENLQKEIEEINTITYEGINNGVYKCGFAQSQEAYDIAAKGLKVAMDKMEERMTTRKFLVGERLTLADVRLFPTLIRMDEVYAIYFKCYFASLLFYPNLMRYTARIFQMPEFRDTVYIDDIKKHYFTSHGLFNTFAVIPQKTPVLEKLRAMDVEDDNSPRHQAKNSSGDKRRKLS